MWKSGRRGSTDALFFPEQERKIYQIIRNGSISLVGLLFQQTIPKVCLIVSNRREINDSRDSQILLIPLPAT